MLVRFNHPLAKRTKTLADDFFTQDFDKFFKGFENSTVLPPVNIKESETNFEIELSVPGFKKEDFQLKLDNDLLTIAAKVEEKKAETTEKYTRKEFRNHSFSRTFTLPEAVLIDDINAKYENGILKVTLPKNQEVLEKRNKSIEVQ